MSKVRINSHVLSSRKIQAVEFPIFYSSSFKLHRTKTCRLLERKTKELNVLLTQQHFKTAKYYFFLQYNYIGRFCNKSTLPSPTQLQGNYCHVKDKGN